jgi:hypothetical protein
MVARTVKDSRGGSGRWRLIASRRSRARSGVSVGRPHRHKLVSGDGPVVGPFQLGGGCADHRQQAQLSKYGARANRRLFLFAQKKWPQRAVTEASLGGEVPGHAPGIKREPATSEIVPTSSRSSACGDQAVNNAVLVFEFRHRADDRSRPLDPTHHLTGKCTMVTPPEA